jgi:hypothetical protein
VLCKTLPVVKGVATCSVKLAKWTGGLRAYYGGSAKYVADKSAIIPYKVTKTT